VGRLKEKRLIKQHDLTTTPTATTTKTTNNKTKQNNNNTYKISSGHF